MDGHDELIAEALRTAGGHLTIGRGGFSLLYRYGATLSGYDCETIKAKCITRGLPVTDTRAIPIAILMEEVIRNPLIAVGVEPDPEPWGSFEKAPLAVVARHY